ncbi:MAG: thiamine-phosphate kinase, partial [Alphaproteobacteria bacterium]
MKEFEIIKKKFLPLSKFNQNIFNPILDSFNLSDDVSLIKNSKKQYIVSKDIFVENIHFLRSDGGKKIAQKLLLTNISDIASSGGKPLFYFLGFTKNSDLSKKFYDDFADGLKKIQDEFNIVLAGGDTSNSSQLFYSVTIFGSIDKNKILLRKNASEGDLIYVSNYIGEAFLGLDIKLKKPKK